MATPVLPVTLLVFRLEDRRFAVLASLVREAVRVVAVTPLPRAPAIVEGVINIRGVLVPVLDIRQRFGMRPAALSLDQHLLIAWAGARLVALRVDGAEALVEVEADAIEPATRVAPGAELVAGLAKLADGVLVIHDLERFLSLGEAEAVDAAVAGAAGAAALAGSARGGAPT